MAKASPKISQEFILPRKQPENVVLVPNSAWQRTKRKIARAKNNTNTLDSVGWGLIHGQRALISLGIRCF